MKYLLMSILMFGSKMSAADATVDADILRTLQSYVYVLSSGKNPSTKHSAEFEERLARDRKELEICRGKSCVVSLREPVEVIAHGGKTRFYAFIDITPPTGAPLTRAGCYILEKSGAEYSLSNYLGDCDGK